VDDQRGLGAGAVDGIHYIVETVRQQAGEILGDEELLHTGHPTQRVDGMDALFHGEGLGLAEFLRQRMNLAVDVGLSQVVGVDQRKPADGRARERLCGPGADAADADDADMRLLKTLESRRAIEPARAAKAALEVDLVFAVEEVSHGTGPDRRLVVEGAGDTGASQADREQACRE
jgi:hypothetical protein